MQKATDMADISVLFLDAIASPSTYPCHAWARPKSKAAACEPGAVEPQDGELFTLAADPRWGVETNNSGLK